MIKWLIVLATQLGTQGEIPTGHCHDAIVLEGMNRSEVVELLGSLEERMQAALLSYTHAIEKNFSWVGKATPEGYGRIVDILAADHNSLARDSFAFHATHTLRATEGETRDKLLQLHSALKATTSVTPWFQSWISSLESQTDALAALAYATPRTLHDIFVYDNAVNSHHRNRLMLKWADAQLQYARTLLHLSRME